MKSRCVAIAGCGPAGLAAALLLSRQGHRISLFDQFDKPAPVGSGLMLQPTGLAVLDAMGLGPRIRNLGQPIRRLFGRAQPSGRTVLDVRFSHLKNDIHAVAVHRSALFRTLQDAVVEAGLELTPATRITGIEVGAGARPVLITAKGKRHGPYDLVVDALGSGSPLITHANGSANHKPLPFGALWATLDWPENSFDPETLEQVYQKARRMIGVLPIGRSDEAGKPQAAFFWSLKATDYGAWQTGGLDAWKAEVRALWPQTEILIAQITDRAQLTFAQYGHHTLSKPFGERLVFVGDSAHSTSPQLGQGANMALLDAAALARACAVEADLMSALKTYARLRRRHVRLYQAMSMLFTPFYQSQYSLPPMARDLGFPIANAMPFGPRLLARLVAGLIGNPLAPLQLARHAG